MGTQAAASAGRLALKSMPFVGMAMDIGEEAKKLFDMYKQGQNIKPLLLKMMAVEDSQRGSGQNVFDLDDELYDMTSESARMKIAEYIIQKLESHRGNPTLPPEIANRAAVNFLKNTIKPFYRKYAAYDNQQRQGRMPPPQRSNLN